MRKILSLTTMLIFIVVLAIAQTRPITGRVLDETGQPVSGASITIRGSGAGASANTDGTFRINAKTGDVLIITAVGIPSKEITVGSGSSLAISLTRQSQSLSEVIVTTALGIQRQAKSLGYSTTKVSSQDLTQAKVTNIATGLSAKVSGLQINLVNNGVKPDTRVTLRGNRSILGNNQALLVVDDVILPINYLNSLNPNDVDNVTVLKGASASALYGSAASNGVIIVTTKRGKGKPVVRLSSTATVEEISYTPKFQNRFGQDGGENDPAQYPGIVGFPGNPYTYYVPYENQNYGPEYNGATVPIGGPVRIYNTDGTFFDSTLMGKFTAVPNSKKDFFNKGLTLQNDISYSSGDEKGSFYLSFQDVDTKGIIPKDVNHRNTIRINGSKISGKFRADYNLGYSITKTNTTPGSFVPFKWGTSDFTGGYNGGGSYFQNRPVYWTLINSPANVNWNYYKDWQHNPFASPDGYFNAYYGNPWWQIDQTRLDERNNDLIGSGSLSYRPFNWLNIMYRGSLARNDYNNKYTKAGYTFADWAIADPLGAGNIPSSVKKLDPTEGDAFSSGQRFISDFLISAQHTFFKDLDAKLILGNQVQNNSFRALSASANALVIPDFYNISNRVGEPNVGEFKVETRTYGVFGDLTLGWKGYLFVHGSLRNDWTSILSKQNRSYLYPATDVSFVFSELLKDKIPGWFSYGKLRGAYSKTAQVSIDPYSLANVFNLAPGFPFANGSGFTVSNRFANSDIKPEFTTEKEIGLELGFLQNRINLTAAYYNAKTNNQTIPITISPTTGFTSALVNSGEMSNKGVELDLKITPLIRTNDGFRWDIGANFAYNNNRVLSIGYGLNDVGVGNNSYAVIGQPYPVLKTNDWVRDSASGKIIVNKVTGTPTINPAQKIFGTSNPPYRIGLNTSISYKGFTLNALADGRFGAVIYNNIGTDLDFTGVSWYSAQSGRQAFVIPNSVIDDGSGKVVPNTNISTSTGNNGFWASTWNAVGSNYINSADFWKLREVSLIYDFPKKWIGNIKAVQALSIGLVGRNLITWRAKQNIWTDPEFSNTNGNGIGTTDINQTPPTRFYGANITITF